MALPPRDPTPKKKGKPSAVFLQPGSGAAATWSQREGTRRLERVKRFRDLQSQGIPAGQAARAARLSRTSAWRWSRNFEEGGPGALIPRPKGPKPSRAVQLGLQPQILSRVQRLAVTHGTSPAGWRAFANDPSCPAELRSAIQPGCAIPEALRSAVRVERRVVLVRVAVLRSGSFTYQHQLKGRRRAA